MDDAAPKRRRGMLGFYVAALALVALAGLGAWLWTAWTNWQFDEHEARRRQAEAARQFGVPVETTVDLGGGVAIDLVLIPAGMFDMGSPEGEAGRTPDEGPVHRVRISRPFYIGKYEVTQEQWEKVMGERRGGFQTRPYNPRHPVENVSWADCQEFLKKVNALGKVKGQLRLPTEAEWEWACRAGTRTRFCFGDDDARLGDCAWFQENSGSMTHPVGGKLPNAWGLHDCCGNVWEWCSDYWGSYVANPWPAVFRYSRDPRGPISGSARVLRGGAWDCSSRGCRSDFRSTTGPRPRDGDVGFRVALSLPAP